MHLEEQIKIMYSRSGMVVKATMKSERMMYGFECMHVLVPMCCLMFAILFLLVVDVGM